MSVPVCERKTPTIVPSPPESPDAECITHPSCEASRSTRAPHGPRSEPQAGIGPENRSDRGEPKKAPRTPVGAPRKRHEISLDSEHAPLLPYPVTAERLTPSMPYAWHQHAVARRRNPEIVVGFSLLSDFRTKCLNPWTNSHVQLQSRDP